MKPLASVSIKHSSILMSLGLWIMMLMSSYQSVQVYCKKPDCCRKYFEDYINAD